MGRCLDAALVFARHRARGPARAALAAAIVLLLFGLCAPGARAGTPALTGFDRPSGIPGTTTLINFDLPGVVPGTTSPQAGDPLGDQYESQGVVFGAGPAGIPSKCSGEFYRDTANARSQPQVAYSFCPPPNGENFTQWAEIEGQLTTWSDRVSVYAGAPGGVVNGIPHQAGGQETTLQGWDVNGNPIAGATDTATAGAAADTLLSISTPSPQIAYFTVAAGGNTLSPTASPLEIDDLSFDVPPAPAPPQLTLNPLNPITQGYQGQSISVPVTVHRFNGAGNPVNLSVSGLPGGVTVTGGSTIAAGSSTTDLTFAIAATAPVTSTQFTITATSAGVSAPPPDQSTFKVNAALTIGLGFGAGPNPSQVTVDAGPCSTNTTFSVVGNAAVPGTLAINSQGDTAGLTVSVSGSDVGPGFFSKQLTLTSDAAGSGTATYTITLTGGAAPPATATLVVDRVPPQVTKVLPASARTPQRLQPGTLVTIEGSGFCPDSTVTFGNKEKDATSTPSDTSADGTSMDVRVPRLATDGPVTVSGASSPGSLAVDSYRNINAYQFPNYTPNIDFDQMTQAFGADQTYWTFSVDLCWPLGCTITESVQNPFAWLLLDIAQNTFGNPHHGSGGACFGFSLSTQRIIEGQEPLSAFSSTSNTIFGLSKSGPLVDYINAVQVSQLSSQFLHHYLGAALGQSLDSGADASQTVYNEIHSILSQGRFPLISLDSGGSGHEVVAYDVERAPPDWSIYVYDSNDPFNYKGNENTPDGSAHKTQVEASRVHVDSQGNWQLPSSGPSSGMTGGASGLVVTDPATLPEDPTMLTSLNGLVDVLLSSAGSGAAGSAGPPPSTVTQVSDESGRTLFGARGNLNTNPATRLDGTPFAPLVGGTARAGADPATPQMILLGKGASALTATVTGTGTGTDTHTFTGQGFTAQVGTRAAPGVADKLTLDPAGGAGFTTDAASKPLTLTLLEAPGNDHRTAEITTTSFKGAGDSLSFTGAGSGLSFVHHGRATTFSITLSGQSPASTPGVFQSGPLPIGAGQTAQISSIKGDSLTGSALKVSIGGHTLTVRNRYHPAQLTRIISLKATKTGKRAVSLTIRAALHQLPAGAQVTFGWAVQRRGYVVATHALLAPAGTNTARFTFTANHPGRYQLTATVTVITPTGPTPSTVSTSRTLSFNP